MDTSYYYNFIILVQTGNMTQAANILHITQPALSKQLKYLEAEFGTPLLHIKRGQRGANFRLTEAGRIFYEKAQQLCAIEEATYEDVKTLKLCGGRDTPHQLIRLALNGADTAIFTCFFTKISFRALRNLRRSHERCYGIIIKRTHRNRSLQFPNGGHQPLRYSFYPAGVTLCRISE